jgi:hypothetical protein
LSSDPLRVPDPGGARAVGDLTALLRSLRAWAGNPSYAEIARRVAAAWKAAGRLDRELPGTTTVYDCFRPDRRRLNTDLVLAIVEVLRPDPGYVEQWRTALRVVGGEIDAASQVDVQAALPEDIAEFTGRADLVDRLRRTLRSPGRAGAVAVIEGMPGVGKTSLAVHVAHVLAAETPFECVLFVDLRGFHPDPRQPPADPGGVLNAFLRVLGLPGHQVPLEPQQRAQRFRDLAAGRRVLVVLDNAANEAQVRPLLPGGPASVTLVTSRRSLAELAAHHVLVEPFSTDEAVEYLSRVVHGGRPEDDREDLKRVAKGYGRLPLALAAVAGHMRTNPHWSAGDHADWLDERRADHRLDPEVDLALDLSYQDLPQRPRRLLRLLALHPSRDADAHAAAALTATDPANAAGDADWLCQEEHLLRRAGSGRYTLHDVVRQHAVRRATDEDRPADRRAALTRLFDYYLAAAAAAADTLFPAERRRRRPVPAAATALPDLSGPDAARGWLDDERQVLVDVAR